MSFLKFNFSSDISLLDLNKDVEVIILNSLIKNSKRLKNTNVAFNGIKTNLNYEILHHLKSDHYDSWSLLAANSHLESL